MGYYKEVKKEVLMTQKETVYQFCEAKEGYFTLADAYEGLSFMKCPTIRYYLQVVRDAGVITFVDNKGLYKKS